MKNQVLSIEQMQLLKELGVDTSKASMCYTTFESDANVYHRLDVNDEDCYEFSSLDPIPTFTLQDIIDLLPKRIDDYRLVILLDDGYVRYETEIGRYDECGDVLAVFDNTNIIQSAYEMLIWVAENGYLKTK